jgi:hypothetical protein
LDDLIVFENSDPNCAYTGFRIGWKSGNADIRVLVGGAPLGPDYDFTGETFADLLVPRLALRNSISTTSR